MRRKYYLSDFQGKNKIFGSFNQMLRYLKLSEEEEMQLADILGKIAFTGNEEIYYKDGKRGIHIEYR